MEFHEKYGPWGIVTGASSGIGAEFARQLARRGLHLLLVARRKERLERLASELQELHPIDVRIAVSDLSRENFLQPIRRAAKGIDVGLLVNNAGYGLAGHFLENEPSAERNMIHVNCVAPTVLAHEFGRPMAARKRGGIIFVASVLGYLPVPYMANYGATKAYNLFLAESLWQELRPAGIDVLALSPGPTATEFAGIAGMNAVGAMSPEQVVETALRSIGRTPSVIPSRPLAAGLLATRLLSRKTAIRAVGFWMKLLGRHKPGGK